MMSAAGFVLAAVLLVLLAGSMWRYSRLRRICRSRDAEGARDRAIIMNASDSIFTKDRQLRYTQANPAMERLFERSAGELIGRSDDELFGREAAAHIQTQDRRVLAGEVLEEEHTKPVMGVPHSFHVIKAPMYAEGGDVIGLCGIARDVTVRKRTQEALTEAHDRFSAFMDRLPGCAIIKDEAGGTVFTNRYADEVIGDIPWLSERPGGDEQRPISRVEAIPDRRGRERTYRIQEFPITREGQASLRGCIALDITDLNEAEELRDRHARHSERLRHLLVMLNACGTMPEALGLMLDAAVEMTGMEGGAVYLLKGGYAHLQHHRGLPAGLIGGIDRISLESTNASEVLESIGPVRLDQLSGEVPELLRSHGLRHVYTVALNLDREVLGVLALTSTRAEGPDELSLRTLVLLTLEAESCLKRLRTEEDLRESEGNFRRMFDQAPIGAVVISLDGCFVRVNEVFCRMTGYEDDELAGKAAADITHPDDLESATQQAIRLIAGEITDYNLEHRFLRKDGTVLWVQVSMRVMRDPKGEPLYFLPTYEDLTERKREEERQRLMVRELNHRVKNTLATVVAICDQSLESADSLGAFSDAFRGRIASLSQAHEALAHARWEGARIQELLRRSLAPYDDAGSARVKISGEDALLPARVVAPIGMALHELTTNAAKHGALSRSSGRIEVKLRTTPEDPPILALEWIETGVDGLREPARRGLGLALIEQGVGYDTGGRVRIEFAPDGLRCEMLVPLA